MRRTTATQSLTQRVMNASLPRRHAQVRSSSDARRDDIITCRLAVSVRVGLPPLYTIIQGDLAGLALLDLSAAFDTVDHDVLLQRLRITYGIDGMAWFWFRSYLADRFQYTSDPVPVYRRRS